MNIFIVSPQIGLCNQIQSIVKSILLSIKYNRNIYINKFQIDLLSRRFCDINNILDIDRINNFYIQNNINIKILKDFDNNIQDLEGINYNSIPHLHYINDIIELNLDKQCIYLGNPVSLCIYKSFNYIYNDYNNLYYLIMNNLFFNDKFYIIKDKIKQELNLNNYNTCHLRIENDAIYAFSKCYNNSQINDYNKLLLDWYLNAFNILTDNTYICTGILKDTNNMNIHFYEKLMENTLLCDKTNLIIDEYYLNNRELIAIIDLLIAYDSNYFIGCHISSFSLVIQAYLINKGKKVLLTTPDTFKNNVNKNNIYLS